MRRALLTTLTLSALLGAGCDPKPKPPAPVPTVAASVDGWPDKPYWFGLDEGEERLRRQSTEGNAAGFNLLAPEVIRKHYDEPGPTAHGAVGGTDVYWVKDKGVFFIRSECEGHHQDGYLGPFQGDPREVLRPVSERKAR